MLNLWIGLCKGAPGLPRAFREMGYREHSVEPTVGKTNPELIIASERLSHSVVFEWKSGKNTDADQLLRYSLLSQKELQQLAFLSVNETKTFDVVLIGLASNVERLKIGAEGKFPFPILAVDDSGLLLVLNKFKSERLNAIFNPRLQVDLKHYPVSFVPIGPESELAEVAAVVIPKILDRMHRRDTIVKAKFLSADCCEIWDILSKKAKAEIERKVCEVLSQAAAGEFASFFEYRLVANDSAIQFTHNPVEYAADKRSAAFRRLLKAQKEFQLRLASGRKYEVQPSLPFPRDC